MFDIAAWRERWPRLDAVMAVNDRFSAIGGGPLASSIALSTFFSLFPLLLVGIAVIGFVSSGDAGFASSFIDDLGLEGRAADTLRDAISAAESSRRAASIVGFGGLVLSGLGVVGALQRAVNSVWQVQGRGLLDRVVALGWLMGAGVLFATTAALSPLLRWAPGPVRPLTILAGLVLTTVLFVWTYHALGSHSVGWRAHLPGAVLVAVGVEILKVVGTVVVPTAVARSSALYGSLGVVFAVLSWLLLYGRLIVYGAVVNVLRYERQSGTVTVEIEVPRVDGEVPLTATRGGAVDETADGGSG